MRPSTQRSTMNSPPGRTARRSPKSRFHPGRLQPTLCRSPTVLLCVDSARWSDWPHYSTSRTAGRIARRSQVYCRYPLLRPLALFHSATVWRCVPCVLLLMSPYLSKCSRADHIIQRWQSNYSSRNHQRPGSSHLAVASPYATGGLCSCWRQRSSLLLPHSVFVDLAWLIWEQ